MSPILYLCAERTYEAPLAELVALDEAGFIDAELCMRNTNRTHVNTLAKSVNEWPAIEVTPVQLDGRILLVVIDGYHRWEASKKLKRTHIKVHVRTYRDEQEVMLAAVTANLYHGLLVQPSKKSDYAVYLYKNGYEGREEEIAKITGLSLQVIIDTINEYLSEDEEETKEEASRIAKLVAIIARHMKMVEKASGKINSNMQAIEVLRYIMSLHPHAMKKRVYDALAIVKDIIELVETSEVIKIREDVKVTLPEYLSMVVEEVEERESPVPTSKQEEVKAHILRALHKG